MVGTHANFPHDIDEAIVFLTDLGYNYIKEKEHKHTFLSSCGLLQITTSDEQNKEKEVVRIRLINDVEL